MVPGVVFIPMTSSRQPRVVSICLDLSPSHGGMYRAVTELAEKLHSPIVSFRDGSGREPPSAGSEAVVTIDWSQCSRLRQAFAPPSWVARSLEEAVAGAECLVVHSLFRSHAMLARRAAITRGVPYIVVPHGALEPALWRTKPMLRQAWLLAGGRAFLRDASRIVFATVGEQQHAEETLGRTLPGSVIPFAVPVSPRRPTEDERCGSRSLLGLPPGRRLLLMLGRLDPVKRPREVIRWFCDADPRECDLVIAGMDGVITADELRAAVPTTMADRIWFLGGVNGRRRDAVFAACDVYLSWSRHESFGYAAAESMAAGLPVILPPGHGLRSSLEGVDCGLFPAGASRDAFVSTVRRCAGWTAAELHVLGNAGRTWVEHQLSPDKVAAMWRALVHEVCQAHRSIA